MNDRLRKLLEKKDTDEVTIAYLIGYERAERDLGEKFELVKHALERILARCPQGPGLPNLDLHLIAKEALDKCQ